MKVLNICKNDWSNFAYDQSKALQAVGIDCKSLVSHSHEFGYPETSETADMITMIEHIKESDIIQIFHSDVNVYNSLRHHIKKRVIVWHAGSVYRNNYKRLNRVFRKCEVIYSLGEFEHCRGHYMVGAIDTPKVKVKAGKKFAHYPSSSTVKGTDKIIEMMKGTKFDYSTDLITYPEQIKRMNTCDIYIELFKPELNGHPYGSWGITALEAAAMGKIVITNHLYKDLYKREYGDCGLLIANTEKEFKSTVKMLLDASDEKIIDLKKKSLKWVKKHSYENSGKRWIQKVIERS